MKSSGPHSEPKQFACAANKAKPRTSAWEVLKRH
jgi:hypothetical protein